MDGGIATVWAAVIGLVAGSGGALLSGIFAFKAGSRQVQDQEISVHRQWLLQQRQEAYVTYLNSSQELIKLVDTCVLTIETALATDDYSIYDGAIESVDVAVYLAAQSGESDTDGPLNVIKMLGPAAVSESANSLRVSMRSLIANLAHMTDEIGGFGPPPSNPLEDWREIVDRTKDNVRANQEAFLALAQDALTNIQT